MTTEDAPLADLGRTVRALRREADLSQRELARCSGVPQATIARIEARARVGNLYVNRNQIGAVVGVQPFGGLGLSGTGPKAGGPDYLRRLCVERCSTRNSAAVGGDPALFDLPAGD